MSAMPSPWSLIEGFGKFASLATAALLVMSTAYDFSFLRALGLSFEELPSTLADHVRSAIVWAPTAIIYLALVTVYELFMNRVEGGLSEDEIVARSPAQRFTRAFRKGPRILVAVLGTFVVAMDFLFSTSSSALFLAAILAWGLLVVSVISHPRLKDKFSGTTAALFAIAPIALIWVASLGYSRGESMMRATVPTWRIELKSASTQETRMLVGLRRFSTAAVLVEPDRRVSIVAADSILRADALRAADADVPRICRWFGFSCPKRPPKA